MDPEVKQAIDHAIAALQEDLKPSVITGFNAFQRKQVFRYFEALL